MAVTAQTCSSSYFYPRPPRGGRPAGPVVFHHTSIISIHALREEGDREAGTVEPLTYQFLSTPSARRATGGRAAPAKILRNFYPRPPRGGRRAVTFITAAEVLFLSTPSARRATGKERPLSRLPSISIHALREEGDQTAPSWTRGPSANFYPRPPRGGRPIRP